MRTTRMRGGRALASIAAVTVIVAGLTACTGGEEPPAEEPAEGSAAPAGETWEGVDDGTVLTLWTRAPLEAQANLLVDADNSTHEDQDELTIVPNDDYVAKIGAAAGRADLR